MEERKKYDIAKKKQSTRRKWSCEIEGEGRVDLLSPGCKVERNLVLLAV